MNQAHNVISELHASPSKRRLTASNYSAAQTVILSRSNCCCCLLDMGFS